MAGATKLWCKHGHLRGFAYHLLTFRGNTQTPVRKTTVYTCSFHSCYRNTASARHLRVFSTGSGMGVDGSRLFPLYFGLHETCNSFFSYILGGKAWTASAVIQVFVKIQEWRWSPDPGSSIGKGLWMLHGCADAGDASAIAVPRGCGRAHSTSHTLRLLHEIPVLSLS